MNYSELYKKAQKDLENVRVQKGQVNAKIKELVEELDLEPDLEMQDLKEQVSKLKQDLEAKQAEYASELDKLAKELEELDNKGE